MIRRTLLALAIIALVVSSCAQAPSPTSPTSLGDQVVRMVVAPHRLGFSTTNDAGVVMVNTTTTRQAFVTDVQTSTNGDGSADVGFACWLTAPAAYVHPRPDITSSAPTTPCRVPPATTVNWGYTASELGQLQNGNIVETCFRSGFVSLANAIAIENLLQTQCGNAQQALISLTPSSGTHLIGLNFDSAKNDGGGGWNLAP